MLDCYREYEILNTLIGDLRKENEVLKNDNEALRGKAMQSDVCPSDINECMSKLMVSSEHLHQKLDDVKDEIISTVVNLTVGACVTGHTGTEVTEATGEAGVTGKNNLLSVLKDEIINTMVNIHAGKKEGGHSSDVTSYAAAARKKNNLLIINLQIKNVV